MLLYFLNLTKMTFILNLKSKVKIKTKNEAEDF